MLSSFGKISLTLALCGIATAVPTPEARPAPYPEPEPEPEFELIERSGLAAVYEHCTTVRLLVQI